MLHSSGIKLCKEGAFWEKKRPSKHIGFLFYTLPRTLILNIVLSDPAMQDEVAQLMRGIETRPTRGTLIRGEENIWSIINPG